MLLAGDSNVWLPLFELGRSRQADASIAPIIPEMMQSHSLVLQNPLDVPTHRCGAALDIILTTRSLPCHRGSICCPVAPLCYPLLASDHMLCSCRLNLPLSVSASAGVTSTMPRVRDWSSVVASCPLQLPHAHSLRRCFPVLTTTPPITPPRIRRRQPLWWNDACFHALVARNGSWRDFRRSGSQEDQARFRHLRQQFHSTVRSSRTDFWIVPLSRRAPRNLCNMNWYGASRSALSPHDAGTHWRAYFASSPTWNSVFSDDFFQSLSLRFAALSSSCESGIFDAPFSHNELVAALSRCHESAPGANGLPYSASKVSFPWWRHLVVSFSNHILRFAVVPSAWKSSPPQGGFRWGADTLACSLVDSLRLRRHVHTFVAFIDIKKAFDSCWVETSWASQVVSGTSLISSFVPLCPRSACAARLPSRGLTLASHKGGCSHLSCSTCWWIALPLPSLCPSCGLGQTHLQLALDAVHAWGLRWRFSFGVGPTKSAVMVFGPLCGRPDCSVHLGGVSLPLVPHLGATLSPTLSWGPHVDLVCARGDRTRPAPGVVAKVCLSLSPLLSSLLTSFPARHLVWSSSVTTLQHFTNSTSHSVDGADTFLGGPVLLLSQQFTGSLLLAMHSALPSDVHSLCLVACVPWTTLPLALKSLPGSSGSVPPCNRHGHTGARPLFVPFPFHILAKLAFLWAPLPRPSDVGSLKKPILAWIATCMSCLSMSLLTTSPSQGEPGLLAQPPSLRGASVGACSLGSRPFLHRPPLPPPAWAFHLPLLP